MIFAMRICERRLHPGPARYRGAAIHALAGCLGLLVALLHAGAALAAAEDERVTLELMGMTYVASEGAENQVVVAAERATVHPDIEVARLAQMRATISARPAEEGSSGGLDMTCDRGLFELASGDFVAEGDVRGTTADGRRFRTSRLRYHHDTGRVEADVPVEIRDAAGTYRGGGFEYWVRENRFRLSGGATVVQEP